MEFENGVNRLSNELELLKKSDARKRLEILFDNGEFTEIDRFAKSNGDSCGVVTAYGYICGMYAYAFSQDISDNNGAMSVAQAKKIKKVYELAEKTGAPIIGIFDSNGAMVTEGINVLNAYGDLIKIANNISGVVPQISVIAGCCIGSAAVLAAQADIVIMAKDAELCVTSANVLGDKTSEIGSAELNEKNGIAALIADSANEAVEKAVNILSLLPSNNLSLPMITEYVPSKSASYDTVDNIIDSIIDSESFVELFKNAACCAKIGFARIGGTSVGIVATNSSKNDGLLCGKGAAKIARFVRLCDAFSIPVITLLDSHGIMGTAKSELSGDVKAVAMLTHAYSEATVAKITIITGKAYGCSFTSMAGTGANIDFAFAWPNAVISALPPMTAVQFMYNDRLAETSREDLENEYCLTEASPFKAAADGNIDDVITPEETVGKILNAIEVLASKRVSTLNKKHSNIQL